MGADSRFEVERTGKVPGVQSAQVDQLSLQGRFLLVKTFDLRLLLLSLK